MHNHRLRSDLNCNSSSFKIASPLHRLVLLDPQKQLKRSNIASRCNITTGTQFKRGSNCDSGHYKQKKPNTQRENLPLFRNVGYLE